MHMMPLDDRGFGSVARSVSERSATPPRRDVLSHRGASELLAAHQAHHPSVTEMLLDTPYRAPPPPRPFTAFSPGMASDSPSPARQPAPVPQPRSLPAKRETGGVVQEKQGTEERSTTGWSSVPALPGAAWGFVDVDAPPAPQTHDAPTLGAAATQREPRVVREYHQEAQDRMVRRAVRAARDASPAPQPQPQPVRRSTSRPPSVRGPSPATKAVRLREQEAARRAALAELHGRTVGDPTHGAAYKARRDRLAAAHSGRLATPQPAPAPAPARPTVDARRVGERLHRLGIHCQDADRLALQGAAREHAERVEGRGVLQRSRESFDELRAADQARAHRESQERALASLRRQREPEPDSKPRWRQPSPAHGGWRHNEANPSPRRSRSRSEPRPAESHTPAYHMRCVAATEALHRREIAAAEVHARRLITARCTVAAKVAARHGAERTEAAPVGRCPPPPYLTATEASIARSARRTPTRHPPMPGRDRDVVPTGGPPLPEVRGMDAVLRRRQHAAELRAAAEAKLKVNPSAVERHFDPDRGLCTVARPFARLERHEQRTFDRRVAAIQQGRAEELDAVQPQPDLDDARHASPPLWRSPSRAPPPHDDDFFTVRQSTG